jgi:oligosaccharide translocation protein RFT1
MQFLKAKVLKSSSKWVIENMPFSGKTYLWGTNNAFGFAWVIPSRDSSSILEVSSSMVLLHQAPMTSKSTPSTGVDDASTERDSLLSTSAGGATLLIGLQVSSRALTFIVNQILLRYLSPELLGISTQLEVYSISVLFFARESLRVAIQRQADISDESSQANDDRKAPEGHVDGRTAAGRTQAIVNLAYVSINLGVVFAVFFAALYYSGLKSSDPAILETPYFGGALKLYGFAAVWELLSEPCFVVVQQKSRFKIRAAAESVGTLFRCLVTCGSAIWAARNGRDLGVLPFALGQGIYAISLSAAYYWSVWSIASSGHFSLSLNSIYSRYASLIFAICSSL